MTPEALKIQHDLHHPWMLIGPLDGHEGAPDVVIWRSTSRVVAVALALQLGLSDWTVAKQTDTADNHADPTAVVVDKLLGVLAQRN